MSVNRKEYIMLAQKLDKNEIKKLDNYDFLSDEKYYGDSKSDKNLILIESCYDDSYAFLGKILAKGDNDYGLEPYSPEIDENIKLKIEQAVIDDFKIDNPDVKIWIFTHWT